MAFQGALDIEAAIRDYKPGQLVPRLILPGRNERDFLANKFARTRPIRVVALEGPHGVGKSTLAAVLRALGYHCLHEHFMDTYSDFIAPGRPLHNCLVETAWASAQVLNIVNMAYNIRRELFLNPNAHDTFFLDRCFLTACCYGVMDDATTGHFLRMFYAAIHELREVHGIIFTAVQLRSESSCGHHIHAKLCSQILGSPKLITSAKWSPDPSPEIEKRYDSLQRVHGVFAFEHRTDYNILGTGHGIVICIPIARFFADIGLDSQYKGAPSLFYIPSLNTLISESQLTFLLPIAEQPPQ